MAFLLVQYKTAVIATWTAAMVSIATGPAAAQGSDRQARVWAASCAGCHGTDGRAAGAIPAIGGREADAVWRALLEFKGGQRPAATVMHQHTKGYTDDELLRIARVFAESPATPTPR